MHISEGVLSIPALAVGWGGAAILLGLGLKKTASEELPKAAVFGSAFFLASLVKVPVGVSSAHFTLLGLMGLTLGYAAVPAIFIALFLQALLFQFGGLLSLGANTLIMALPALLSHLLFSRLCAPGNTLGNAFGHISNGQDHPDKPGKTSFIQTIWPWLAGFCAIILGLGLLLAFLFLSNEMLLKTAWAITLSTLPLAILEGFVTLLAVGFLRKTSPALLAHSTS